MSDSSQTRSPIRRPPLSVRLNDQEYEALRQRANGMPLSSFMKLAALGDAAPVARRRNPPSRDQKILAMILAALGQSRLPNNLNQLAKAANSGSLPVNAETHANLAEACRDVQLIRRALLLALGVVSDQEPSGLTNSFNAASGAAS